ncbi:MAG: helix-turn-helix domain-containing protein [Spirochaetales bacterium]
MLRVNEVKMQLAHSDKPLREIADRFGFTDQYHLSRVFKQYVGASPTAWRRRGEP